MRGKKYSTFLTVLIVIVIIIILVLISKLVYDIFDKKNIKDSAEEVIADFDRRIDTADTSSDNNINAINTTEIKTDLTNFTYGGYNMMGYIEIPTIKIKYPVLETVTTHSIEIAVAIRAGVGLNQVGNTVIVGHNYRNGLFFSDLNKLKINDIIYITDRSGTKIKYKVYNVFSTTPEDSSYYDKNTDGKREISLATCSDTGKMRTVVEAREVSEEEEQNTMNQQQNSNTITNQITSNNNTISNGNNAISGNNTTTNNTSLTNNTIKINRTEIKK